MEDEVDLQQRREIFNIRNVVVQVGIARLKEDSEEEIGNRDLRGRINNPKAYLGKGM